MECLNSQSETTTAYNYDKLGRITQSTDALEGKSTITYTKNGNIKTLSDPNGGITTYTYDSMNRVTKEVNPVGSTYTYTYNALGLLEEKKNARNDKTKYTYDKLGRITCIQDETGKVTYKYDANGNILEVSYSKGTIKREYDQLNRVTKYTDYKGNTVSYSYDEIGNLISLTYPGGEIVRYTYYKNGLLHTVTDDLNQITEYKYDKTGRLIETIRPNGTVEERTYDNAGQLKTIKDYKGEQVINEYTYTYDLHGNITKIEEKEKVESVTGEDLSKISSSTMTYDSANRLITYNGEEVKYDADGNMTYGPLDGKMVTYTYDSRNRLVSVGNISYEYDCENNRIALVKGDYREDYIVDTVSSAFSRVLVRNITTKDSETTTLYHYGNGLISQRTGADYSFYHFNHNGSTTALTDLVGKITNTYTYGPYGELLTGDTTVTNYLYNGQYGVQTDPNGLYYMRQRYYNTEIKRFINQDILTGSINNSQSLNRYCYVQGNPISYTDPFGLSPLGIIKQAGHTVLDFIGLCPGIIGAFADSFNCFWYAVEGDTANAILSGVSAIPGLGAFAGAKLAVKGGKYAKVGNSIQKITSLIGNGATFTRTGAVTLNMGTAMWDKYVIQGEQLSGETGLEVLIWGLSGFTTIVSGKECLSSGNALRKLMQPDTPTIKTYTRASGSRSEGPFMRLNLQFFASKGRKNLINGISNNPQIVRRFMSKQEYKQFKKKGFIFNAKDSRGGISSTSTKIRPENPDSIRKSTGALGADYYVDIDVSCKNVFFKGITKGGVPDWKIQDDVYVDDIISSGKVKK